MIDFAKLARLQMAFTEKNAALRGMGEEYRRLIGHTARSESPGYVQSDAEFQRVHALKKRIAELELETAPLGQLVASLERYASGVAA
jgi:hypothetical protein